MNQNENWIFQVQKKEKKTFEKKIRNYTRYQLSLNIEKNIEGMKKAIFCHF